MFNKVRLITDWDNISARKSSNIVSQEAFFNVCFAMSFGRIITDFMADGDLYPFFREFGLLWSIFNYAADYATRFNDDDLWHTLFWAGFGAGLVAIMMHAHSEKLHFCIAGLQVWVSLVWLRVAAALPRCRKFAFLYTMMLLVTAALVIAVGLLGLKDTYLSLVPLFIHPAGSIAAAYIPLRGLDIPMNIEYHIPKCSGMTMLIMGQLVGKAATPPREGQGPHNIFGFYVDAACVMLLIVSFKLIFTDCDVTQVEHHAIRKSKRSALIWLLLCQPALNFAIIVCAAGIGCILNSRNTGLPDVHGKHLTSYACAAMFLVVRITQRVHQDEPLVVQVTKLRRWKDVWQCTLAVFAFSSALLPQLDMDPLPIIAFFALCTVAVGLVRKNEMVFARRHPPDPMEGVGLASITSGGATV